MWFISQLELRSHQLAGAASGMDPIDAMAVYSEEICVANALNLVENPADGVQLSICDSCGIEHCNQNDRAVLRRAGDLIVLSPDFRAMEEVFPDAYALPPSYFGERGVPVLSAEFYGELRHAAPQLVDASALEPLRGPELARILQWEAPGGLLGLFPDTPHVQRGAVVAVSSGDTAQQVERLNTRLERLFVDRAALRFEPTAEPTNVERFILDNSALEEWSIPLQGDSFLADPRHLVVPVRA